MIPVTNASLGQNGHMRRQGAACISNRSYVGEHLAKRRESLADEGKSKGGDESESPYAIGVWAVTCYAFILLFLILNDAKENE